MWIHRFSHPKRAVIVGGGNVAMDAARCAKRLGVEEVTIVYRRSMDELPARKEEVEHAMEEGIVFKLLTNPVRVLGNEDGWVCGMECVSMELGEPGCTVEEDVLWKSRTATSCWMLTV